MRKALFLRLSLAEKRKGTQCADAGSPISLNIRDPISDISKKSEIGVMNHEKMAGRTQLSARSKRRWRSHRQYHHCRRYGRRGAGGCLPRLCAGRPQGALHHGGTVLRKTALSGADGGRCAFAGLCRSRNGPQRRNGGTGA